MAKQTVTNLTDDIDGSTEGVDTYHLGLAGVWYEIDLTEKNASKLDKFFEVARPVSTDEITATYTKRGRKSGDPSNAGKRDKETVAKARAWGAANGFAVSGHGRLSRELWAAFDAA